jgi:hypothetical protein
MDRLVHRQLRRLQSPVNDAMRLRLSVGLVAGMALSVARGGVGHAQIVVNPNGVNVNAQNATTVFLTYGGLGSLFLPADAEWCGELVPAAPAVGLKCDPATLFGRLPARYNQSRLSGAGGFTDIMSIPPSVARRAYQAAELGTNSAFYYVRRFVRTTAGPDVYVVVTCRMAGGGARVPLALTDVRLAFGVETPVLFLEAGAPAPALSAELTYNGTGRLKGRWEIVLPGEELPEPRDLLTEASLPLEERGSQQRYSELERFNVLLTPTGKYTLRGPDPSRIPTTVAGTYLVLLRIEASDDKEGDSNLGTAGAGGGVVHSGAVAGFPLPTLRYLVGSGGSELSPTHSVGIPSFTLREPLEGMLLAAGQAADFSWSELVGAELYRLEIQTEERVPLLTAVIPRGTNVYHAPPWLAERAAGKAIRWRVVALDVGGRTLRSTPWRPGGFR